MVAAVLTVTVMGNVQASESGGPPPGSQAGPAGAQTDRNPGTVEDLHKDCKEVFPIPFEGAKLLIQKALSSTFQARPRGFGREDVNYFCSD